MSKHPVSYRLESSTMALIKRLSDELGLTHTDVVEEAIKLLQREIDDGEPKPSRGVEVVHFPPHTTSEPPTQGNAEREEPRALRLSDLVFGAKSGTGKD